jgi:hypothetical protein
MTYRPVGGANARPTSARPAVGGRCAPVTARGRAVLDETRRRLQQVEAPVDRADVRRVWA